MYTGHDNGNIDTYMMPGTELNPRFPSPVFENSETMTNDGTSGYIVDPSLYYPATTGYGYYYTGFESPGEWDENNAVYGVDGTNVYMAQGAQSENVPYVYYAPNYGYGDTPFNPYNPYIPGAMMGVDGSLVGTQPYYVSPYSDSVTSAEYYSALVHSGTNVVPSGSTNTISDVGPSTTHRVNNSSIKHTHSSSPASFSVNHPKATSSQTSLLKGASQFSKANTGTTKLPMSSCTNGSTGSASFHVSQNGNTPSSLQSVGTLLPELNQPKFSYPGGGSSYDCTTTTGQAIMNDEWSKFFNRRTLSDLNGRVDPLSEQNRGPRTKKSKNQIIVRAYTTKAGNCNSEGNIVISADDYNKDDLPLDYTKAKFFVIKSYSEDDVHKSIKYNVWSSTPNGNRKLNSVYEDAQKLAAGNPRGCPIFLFFSVNASGQFCGVAEMVGPVEFDRDMDFWQQDKWSGSFPVKWHIIKDVSNPTFRHIILENNEHKPATNSRDTQEILHKPGLEMLKVFKNYTSKTSLLDDFIYYENRQKVMFEERARLLHRANIHGHTYTFQQPIKLNNSKATADRVTDQPPKDGTGAWVEKVAQPNNLRATAKTEGSPSEKVLSSTDSIQESGATNTKPNALEVEPTVTVSTLKIGSLSIHPKPQVEPKSTSPSSTVNTSAPKTSGAPANVVTVGSMPIKVDGVVNKSSGTVTIGTIALDPKALHNLKAGLLKGALQK